MELVRVEFDERGTGNDEVGPDVFGPSVVNATAHDMPGMSRVLFAGCNRPMCLGFVFSCVAHGRGIG